MDKGAGVYLLKKLCDKVEPGDSLYRIHAQFSADFNFAVRLADTHTGYRISQDASELTSWTE